MPPIDTTKSHIKLRLLTSEPPQITINEVGLFLYDFGSLYELVRLAIDPKYKHYKFSRFSLYRNNRPIRSEDRIYVDSISHQSPLDIVTLFDAQTIAALGAIWVFIQALDKIVLLPGNYRKQQLDLEKATLEIKKAESDIEKAELDKEKTRLEIGKLKDEELPANKEESRIITLNDAQNLYEERGASLYIGKAERKLKRSPIKIEKLEMDFINPESDDKQKSEIHRWLEK